MVKVGEILTLDVEVPTMVYLCQLLKHFRQNLPVFSSNMDKTELRCCRKAELLTNQIRMGDTQRFTETVMRHYQFCQIRDKVQTSVKKCETSE